MKIIAVSNFDNESISDSLVAENVSEYYANYIVEFLNNKFGGVLATYFYRVVEDEYKLYIFEP